VHRGWSASTLTLVTDVGDVAATVEEDDVTLTLPPARDLGPVECVVGGSTIAARFVDAGVPHLVLPVDDVAAAPLGAWGPALRRDPRFGPAGTNVDLVQALAHDRLLVRTWERGVEGETLACGSAAVAAAAARAWSVGVEAVTVVPASGMPLRVRVTDTAISLAGDARLLLEGQALAAAVGG
jgi:diaminopimelate epimerase